jgi:hypothetical protein
MSATRRQIAWLNRLEEMLTAEEKALLEDMTLVVAEVVDGIEGLVEDLPADSPSRDIAWLSAQPALEQLVGKLNDKLKGELGSTLVGLQRPVREHATQLAAGDTTAPLLAAGALLARTRMSDASIAAWLERKSPSRWMTNLQNSIGNAVRSGWQRDAAGRELAREVGAAVQQLIATAIETIARTAIWDFATTEQEAVWDPEGQWKYLAVLDPSTCPICRPWANQEGARNELPEVPQHPRCRCVVVPAA